MVSRARGGSPSPLEKSRVPAYEAVMHRWSARAQWGMVLAGWSMGFGACQRARPSTPEAVVVALAKAIDQGNVALFLELTPDPARLEGALSCEPGASLIETARRQREEVAGNFSVRRQAGLRMRLGAVSIAPTVTLGVGDLLQGCTLKTALEVARAEVSLGITRAGRRDALRETWTLVRFEPDGANAPWFALDP